MMLIFYVRHGDCDHMCCVVVSEKEKWKIQFYGWKLVFVYSINNESQVHVTKTWRLEQQYPTATKMIELIENVIQLKI